MLSVRELVKVYGDFVALKGISFDVRRGEILGLIGENGAGKSTTIKILVGLITPTSGSVYYDGENFLSNREKLKKKIGYVPETDSLYDYMTAEEYLRFFASLYNVKVNSEILDELKIPRKVIGEMSKGMRRKLTIARSLIHDPSYLIYDEPFSGLDPMTSLAIADFLKGLRDKAILLSAHNLYYIEYVCDRVVIMKGGEIIHECGIEEIRGLKTYIIKTKNGVIKTNDIDELVEILRNEEVINVDVDVKKLEDLYFELMRR